MRADAPSSRVACSRSLLALSRRGAVIARPYAHGLSFVVRAADMQGTRATARRPRHGARRRSARSTIPTTRRLDARAASTSRRAPHRAGAADVRAARRPASTSRGWSRLARQLVRQRRRRSSRRIFRSCRASRLSPAITDAIEQRRGLARHRSRALAPDRHGRPDGHQLQRRPLGRRGRPRRRSPDRVAYVLSLGGHDDLPRVLRYLCTGDGAAAAGSQLQLTATRREQDPGAFVRPPHDYGVAVILLGARRSGGAGGAGRAAARRRPAFSASVGARRASTRPRAGARVRGAARRSRSTLPEPSATLLRYVNDRDVVHLGARLLPYVGCLRRRPGAVAVAVAEAVGAGLPAARHRRQRHPVARIRVSGRGSARPRAGPAAAERPHLARRGRSADARRRRRCSSPGFWGDLLSR